MKNFFKKTFFAAQLVLIALISFSTVAAQPGAIDPTFNGSAFLQPAGNVRDTALQADGKILAAGNFEIVSGFLRNSVVRLNADGTVDAAFNPPEFGGASFGNLIQTVGLQSNGKIIVAGNFTSVNGASVQVPVIRLNTDGSYDNSFAVPTTFGFVGSISDIEILPDDKILIGGAFSYTPAGGGSTRQQIARLNPNGASDSTFVAANNYQTFNDIEVQPDGKILGAVLLSGNNYFLKRLNPDGTEDASFNALTNGTLHYAFEVQADGKILVGGFFSVVNNFPRTQIARLNADGSLDQTFTASSDGNGVFDIEVTADGKILVGGRFNAFNGSPKARIARLNGDGTTDASLNFINPTAPTETRISELYDILPLPDGRVIISGVGVRSGSGLGGAVFRLDASGAIDQTFRVQIGTRGAIGDIAVQPDGKILVAGVFSSVSGAIRVSLARFNADGSADSTFDAGFFNSSADPIVFAVTLQPDGKILVGGRFGLIRRNSDGSADTSFNTGIGSSFVYDVAVQPDGKIIAVGAFSIGTSSEVKYVARFNQDGSLDNTFQSLPAPGAPRKIVIQPDGKLLIGGGFTAVGAFTRGRIARLNADGSLDNSFNPLGGANDLVSDLDVQPDGKVVIGGSFTNVNGTNRNYIARLNADGSLDSTFNASANFNVAAVKIQSNGKILIGGNFGIVNGAPRNGVARLNADGSLDSTFNVGAGTNGSVYTLAIQPDNKILVGGIFTRYNNVPRLAIVRLLNNSAAARTQFDFDGDRRADVALFRPSNGFWYILPSQTNAFYGFPFGQAGDQIAPADYDGDGKTDIAVWRGTVPGAGNFAYFYIINSADNTFRAVQFGATGDVPAAGDWDGDGRADLAVYREGASGGQSFFYYRPSSQPGVNFNTIALGTAGDKPLVGDFDGDGKLDAAVFRASTATWIILRSSDGVTTQTNFGLSTDIPVPADYDGDGAANIAVFRPSSGTWFTSTNPANNYGAIQFGTNGDMPVPADYDGDGKADVAVFRPSNGAWYLNRSTQGFTGVSFGSTEDKSVPNAYIR